MTRLKNEVYKSVNSVKQSSEIDSSARNKLMQDYKKIQDSFNSNYDEVLDNIDLDLLTQGKCIIRGYKKVLAPFEEKFLSSAQMASNFNQDVILARGGATIGVYNWGEAIIGLLKEIAKYRIKACKSNIENLKFKNWQEIQL
ncbi:MAG: hypothetical protein KF862_08990 [Chitinophagaceae bacterium]|nr:hypothetical protein [Chitinophagaceae bacterium]